MIRRNDFQIERMDGIEKKCVRAANSASRTLSPLCCPPCFSLKGRNDENPSQPMDVWEKIPTLDNEFQSINSWKVALVCMKEEGRGEELTFRPPGEATPELFFGQRLRCSSWNGSMMMKMETG